MAGKKTKKTLIPEPPRAVRVKPEDIEKDLEPPSEEISAPATEVDKPATPRAIPSKQVTELATATALVTKTKYVVNRWWNLKRGEEISAPRVVITALKNAGLVK